VAEEGHKEVGLSGDQPGRHHRAPANRGSSAPVLSVRSSGYPKPASSLYGDSTGDHIFRPMPKLCQAPSDGQSQALG
jgi:hypothetical protein